MWELIGMVLGGLLVLAMLALGVAGGVRWRANRRMDDAVRAAAAQASRAGNAGGPGGPSGPV